VQGHVRGPELGTEIVTVLAHAVSNLLGVAEVFVSLCPVIVASRRYREHEMECSPKGKDLRVGIRGRPFFQTFSGRLGDCLRLGELTEAQEDVRHPK
jgi:hypothetical protein